MIERRKKFPESYSAGCHFKPTFILDATRVSCKEQQRQRQVMCVMILNAMLCGIIAIAIYFGPYTLGFDTVHVQHYVRYDSLNLHQGRGTKKV